MKYEKLEHFVSIPRMDRFLTACNGSKTKAQDLYKTNLRIAESFYPVFHLFEVFIRNTINYELTNHFSNPDWIVTEKNGFMSNPSLRPSKFFLKSQIINAEKRVKKRGGTITSGRVIAEQTLGFWTGLFDTHHYKLLRGKIIKCFPNRPKEIRRKEINITLDGIREFRNRVYHNEPVCFKDAKIDFTEALKIKNDIHNVLNWIDADLSEYINQFDHIERKVNDAIDRFISTKD